MTAPISLDKKRYLKRKRERDVLRTIRDLEKATKTAQQISGCYRTKQFLKVALHQLYEEVSE